MAFPCRDENCKKSFSTKYNRNKHEKRKGHGPQLQGKPKILPTENLYYCPTYKANIVEHLKLCVESKEKQNTAAKKNMPDFPKKSFLKNGTTTDTCKMLTKAWKTAL